MVTHRWMDSNAHLFRLNSLSSNSLLLRYGVEELEPVNNCTPPASAVSFCCSSGCVCSSCMLGAEGDVVVRICELRTGHNARNHQGISAEGIQLAGLSSTMV